MQDIPIDKSVSPKKLKYKFSTLLLFYPSHYHHPITFNNPNSKIVNPLARNKWWMLPCLRKEAKFKIFQL